MKRGKKQDVVAEPQADDPRDDLTPARDAEADVEAAPWDGPTRAGEDDEIAVLAAESVSAEVEPADAPVSVEVELAGEQAAGTEEAAGEPEPIVETTARLESILESLLYAADRPLTVSELKRLVNERDGKKVAGALEALRERRAETGIQLASLAGGWQFRTHPENAPWVAKLVAGRPQRLTRAML
jgi:segregation and condensation protein B